MPLAFNSGRRDGAILAKADNRSALASENSPPRTTISTSTPSILQHKKMHPVPLPVMGGSSSLVGSVAEVPLNDAFRTSVELPRTPLKPVSGTSLQQGNNSSRARSLASATKIPRASQIARSASPFRAPGSAKPRATPSRKGAVKSVVARGLQNTPAGASTKLSGGKKPRASSTPSRANLVPTAEDLAAFARTPKVARTPPGSAATGGRPRSGAGLFPADPVDEPPTKQHGTANASGANPVAVASTATTPQRMSSPKRSSAISFDTPEPSNPGENMVGGNAVDPRLQQQAASFAAAAGTIVPARKTPLSPDAELVEPPAALIFGRSNKLARTPPRTGGKQAPTAPLIPSAMVTDEESQGVHNRVEIDSFNSDIHHGSRIGSVSDGPERSSGAVPKRASAGGALPSSAKVPSVTKLRTGRVTAAKMLGDAAIALRHVEEQIAEPPTRRLLPTARTSAAAAAGPVVTSAMRGRTTERESLSSRPPASDRYVSPMPRDVERDVDMSGNVRVLADGTGEGIELGSGYRGTLTPAVFKGLSSGMRTPSIEMKRANDVAEKVPPMRSLDPASSKRPSVDEVANASTSSQKQRVPPRVGLVRGLRGERSSVAEAAAAAAAAAARRTAALVAAAGSDSHAEGETQPGNPPEAEVMQPSRVSSSPAIEATYSANIAEEGDSVLKELDLRSVVGGEVIYTAAVGCVAGETRFQRKPVVFLRCSQDVSVSDTADSNLDKDVSDDGDGSQNVSARGAPAVSISPAIECGSTRPGTATTVTTKREHVDQESKVGAEAEPFLDIDDPFFGSKRLVRTPPAAAQNAQAAKSPLLPSSSSSSIVLESAAVVGVEVGGTKGDGNYFDGDANTNSGAPHLAAAGRGVHKGTPQGGGGGVSGSSTVCDPFASRNKLPRTPVEQQFAAGESLVDKRPSESFSAGVVPNNGGSRDGGRQAELLEAHLEIGELQREVACMADRLAKQTDERNRLAEVAFEAQDEAAGLRQKLQQLQKKNVTKSSGETTASPTNGGNGNAGRNIEGSTANTGMCGQELGGGAGSGASVAVSLVDARVVQLEVEKLECEKEKEEVVRKAMKTESELREAQAKVLELAEQEAARHLELLDERYKRAQAQCAEDEKRMEERKLKVQMLIADTKAQMLRDGVLEKEEERTEQALRDGAAALASRAAVLLKASCARNKRMAERVAGLRAGVEETERDVELLNARSRVLENAGRAAKDEAAAVKKELQQAREALASGKVKAEDLCDRLERSEQECREAQKSYEELRAMLTAEESRRMSVERRLSETKHAGETNISVERARRQSTERRLGIAQQTRDEIAIAAAAAAGPALRAAVDAERARRESVERRLSLAERSSVAVEAERKRRLSAERRLELAEREIAELAVAAAAETASAASAADAAAAAARQERNVSRGELLVADTVPAGHSVRKRKRTALDAGETSHGTGRRSSNCSTDDDTPGSRLGDDDMAPTTANAVPVTIGSAAVPAKGKKKRSEKKGEKARLLAVHDGENAAGMVGSKGKKQNASTKGVAAAVIEVGDDGTDVEHEATATVSQLCKRARLSTPAVEYRDDCISDKDEPSPAKVAADGRKRKRSAAKESTTRPDKTSPDGDSKKPKTVAAIPMTKEDGGGIGDSFFTANGENDVATGSRPPRSVSRPSYAETIESPMFVQSIDPVASRSRSRNVAQAVSPPSSPIDADNDLPFNHESESEAVVGKGRRDEGVAITGDDQEIAKSTKNGAPKGKGSEETLVVTTKVKKRAKTQQSTTNKQQAKAKKRPQPSLRGLTSQNEDIEQGGCPTADQLTNSVNAGAQAEDVNKPIAGEKRGERMKTKAYATTADTFTKEAPAAAKGKKLSKRAVDAVEPERNGIVISEKIAAIEKKGRRGSGVGPASGKAKRKAEEAATAAQDRVGPEAMKRQAMQERARANKATGATAAKPKEDSRHKASSGDAGANLPSSPLSSRETATDEDSHDEPTSRLVSPVDPPAQKRSRKLLGAGAARCKTPKPKTKAVPAPATAAAPTAASIADSSASVTSATTATTASRSTAATANAEQSLAVVASGARAVSASFRTSTGSDLASVSSGFGTRGVSTRGQPVLRTNKAVGTAVLGMRAKSKSGIRGTFFQGFLNPKNGFSVPKLKSAVQQP